MKTKVIWAFLLPIVIMVDLFAQILPVDLLFIIVTANLFFTLNNVEKAFLFIPFMGVIAGAFLTSRGIYGVGGVFIPIGLVLNWNNLLKIKKKLLKKSLPLLLMLMVFLFSAIFNNNDTQKFQEIFIYGALSYLTFSFFFTKIHEVNFERIGLTFLLLGVFILRLTIDINDIPGPSNLFDFGFMRTQTDVYGENAVVTKNDFRISYHLPGFLVLIGIVLYLRQAKLNINFKTSFFFILSFLIIFYSGARQNLLCYIIIIGLYYLVKHRINIVLKVFVASMVLLILFNIMIDSGSEVLTRVLTSENIAESSGRSIHYIMGIRYFVENPLWGIGIGYHDYGGNAKWPHNIFIELLAELGVFVSSLIVILSLISIGASKRNGKLPFENLLLLIPFLVKAMVSASLTKNVIIFSIIIAYSFYPKSKIYVVKNE